MGSQQNESEEAAAAQQVEAHSLQVSASWSAPLPPPEVFRQYEEVLLGSADRILKMAEREQEHRHAQDEREFQVAQKVIDQTSKNTARGAWLGFIVLLAAITGGVFIIYSGENITGSVIALLPLVGALLALIKRLWGNGQGRRNGAGSSTPSA